MAMKLHNTGMLDTDNIYLNFLLHPHINSASQDSLRSHLCPHSSSALLIKLEYRIPLRQNEGSGLAQSLGPAVCPHWRCMFDDQDRSCNSLSDIIRSQTRLRAYQYCAEYLSLTNCVACATEFVVACLDSEWAPGGKALYITAWKDYGACENPFDPRWRGHVAPYNHDLSHPKSRSPPLLGGIREAFETSSSPGNNGDGLAGTWPLDSDAEFLKLVTDFRI